MGATPSRNLAEENPHKFENEVMMKEEAEELHDNNSSIEIMSDQKLQNVENIMKEAEETYKNKSSSIEIVGDQLKLHNFQNIMKEADEPYKNSSMKILGDRLFSGVFLNNKKKKYWVDKKSGHNCFMLFARAIDITWGENKYYWHWPSVKETSGEDVDVAELLNVCWLEADVKFNVSNLSPETTYEIAFEVMIKEPNYGLDAEVTLVLKHPFGDKQEQKVNLAKLGRSEWKELKIGEFTTTINPQGEMEFYLNGYNSPQWKRGLIIKGVVIRSKN